MLLYQWAYYLKQQCHTFAGWLWNAERCSPCCCTVHTWCLEPRLSIKFIGKTLWRTIITNWFNWGYWLGIDTFCTVEKNEVLWTFFCTRRMYQLSRWIQMFLYQGSSRWPADSFASYTSQTECVVTRLSPTKTLVRTLWRFLLQHVPTPSLWLNGWMLTEGKTL